MQILFNVFELNIRIFYSIQSQSSYIQIQGALCKFIQYLIIQMELNFYKINLSFPSIHHH
jgi:hypothetical protein